MPSLYGLALTIDLRIRVTVVFWALVSSVLVLANSWRKESPHAVSRQPSAAGQGGWAAAVGRVSR